MKLSTRYLWALGLGLLAALYGLGVYRGLATPPLEFHDFPAYYLPAAELLHGGNPYSIHLPGILAPADTPTWLLCFEPLSRLSIHTASWSWFWINVAALALALCLLVREAGFRGREAVIVGAIGLMYPPIASNLWFGQSEIFLCLLLALMLVALRRRRDSLAGLSLAAAALLRAYPIGLVAYLLVLRRWTALAWTAGGLAAGALLTIWLVGWGTVASYIGLIGITRGFGLTGLGSTMTVAGGLMKHPANLNLAAFIKWLYDRTASHAVPIAVSGAATLAEIIAVAACFYASAGIDADDPDWRGFGLWIVTLSLISPLSWYFFFCCFLPLIVGMAAAWRRGDLPPAALYAIAAAYLTGTLLPTYGHPLYPLLSAATATLPATHPHIDHLLTEKEFCALILTWAAAYFFAAGARRPQHQAPRHQTPSRYASLRPTADRRSDTSRARESRLATGGF